MRDNNDNNKTVLTFVPPIKLCEGARVAELRLVGADGSVGERGDILAGHGAQARQFAFGAQALPVGRDLPVRAQPLPPHPVHGFALLLDRDARFDLLGGEER